MGFGGPNQEKFFKIQKYLVKIGIFHKITFFIIIGRKKLRPLEFQLFKCWVLIGQGFFKKNSYTLILVNPSAFQIGMPLENWSKIEGAIS